MIFLDTTTDILQKLFPNNLNGVLFVQWNILSYFYNLSIRFELVFSQILVRFLETKQHTKIYHFWVF